MTDPERSVLKLLLACASGLATLVVVLVLALWIERSRELRWTDLDPGERRLLVAQELGRIGQVYVPSDFDPRLGFTFEPDTEVRAWGSSFRTNEIGFRAGPLAKTPGVFRVVFVGDSWTFGLGESFADSFPGQFEQLARERSASPVEAWPLAMPGYNVLNQAAALEVIGPLLQPDIVVWCPTANDVSSAPTAGNRGFLLRRDAEEGEPFGDGMYRDYSVRFIDSLRYLERWRRAATEYRRAGSWLESHRIPIAFLFIARWEDGWPAALMAEAGLEAPWVVAPVEWSRARNSFNHGTPESYAKLARLAYRLVSDASPSCPLQPLDPPGEASGPVPFRGAPGSPGLDARHLPVPMRNSIPTGYRPAQVRRETELDLCAGTMDCPSGRMGRRAAILLRRATDANGLRIVLRRIAEAPRTLYPLRVELGIPSALGATSAGLEIGSGELGEVEIHLDYPPDLPPGAIFEIELASDRATYDRGDRTLRSVDIVKIEPEN